MATKKAKETVAPTQEELNQDLLLAARDGNFDGVQSAIADGADIHATMGPHKMNAFLFAAINGDCKTASFLLNQGSNIECENLEGDRAIHLASLAGKERMVEFLISHGADVDAQNFDGQTVLHRGIQLQNEKIVKSALDANVDLTLMGETIIGPATAAELAADKVGETAGTDAAKTAHAIAHKVYLFEAMMETPLPSRFDKKSLTFNTKDDPGFLDQPRVWQQFSSIMEQLKEHEDGALNKEDLMRMNASRVRWIQRGIECHAASEILEHLRGIDQNLKSSDLVSTQGEPNWLLQSFIENEEVETLMQSENWRKEGLEGYRKVLNALPESSRETLHNTHSVQAALQRDETARGRER